MRYLIVGGTSVFGRPLVDILHEKNVTEEIIATKLQGEEGYSGAHWVDLDLRDAGKTEEVIQQAGADIIFDFATQDSVSQAWKNQKETVDVNIIGTINLLNAIKDLEKKPRLVIGGSGEEYGRIGFSEQPIEESIRPKPVNIYGASKASQTMFAELYAKAYGLDVVIVRTFNETATDQDDKFAISSFCHQFARIKEGTQAPVIHTGNINNIRNFTDVRDLARAFDMVADKGKSGEVYNAAREEGISLRDIIQILEKLTGVNVQVVTDRSKVRPSDAPSVVANVEKIYREVGWKAEIPIEDTLKAMLEKWESTN